MADERVRLIAWNRGDARRVARSLRAGGFVVNDRPPRMPAFFKELSHRPPAAIVIDLGHLPSQGRDMGVALRLRKGTRHVPLVFLGGEAGKVAPIRHLIPDAAYTSEARLLAAVRKAIDRPPRSPVVHRSVFAPYAATPLPKKLGLRQGTSLTLIEPPPGFAEHLRPLPTAVRLRRGRIPGDGTTVWFVRDRERMVTCLPSYAAGLGAGSLWIAWPKKASGVVTDLTQAAVRAAGLAHDLVDYKICSVDQTWSALLFRRRGRRRPPKGHPRDDRS